MNEQTISYYIDLHNTKIKIWETSWGEEFSSEEEAVARLKDLLRYNDWISFDQARVVKHITTKVPLVVENLTMMK